MIDRRLFRDVAVAVFLAVPTIALARPQSAIQTSDIPAPAVAVQPLIEQAAMAERTGAERRFAIPS